jgi:hypothetical protein
VTAIKKIDKQNTQPSPVRKPYVGFQQLDGSHPWQEAVPEGFVLYPVRELKRAHITYFNYDLAKEMGLIPLDHPHTMTPQLETEVRAAFGIQIINEFDQKHRPVLQKQAIPGRQHMATRYLQIQHALKNGKTSGDGRCIWNGVVRHEGRIWDVSSRGTGVTCLAPGVVEAGKPLQTGNEDVGYGCGMAELDELYGSAIMSEIFFRQQIPTERMLCILNLGHGYGIGVRASLNLIRPAHLFLLLKQNQRKNLISAVNYFIDRQFQNRRWKFNSRSPNAWDRMLTEVSASFAQFIAVLDVEYIFAWIDWDGDNILADAGIIDYGSIRQFGLRHDQYRYDDVSRFSTNLNEQRTKARMAIQVFLQMVDFMKTGRRRAVENFRHDDLLKQFDQHFETARQKRILYRVGFTQSEIQSLIDQKPNLVKQFTAAYRGIENFKSHSKRRRVPDGVNRPALFNIRRLLREMPARLTANDPVRLILDEAELFKIALKERARNRDRHMGAHHRIMFGQFQNFYMSLVREVRGRRSFPRVMADIQARSNLINREDRMTGNSVTLVVDEILKNSRNGAHRDVIQEIIEHFIESQILNPNDPQVHQNSPAQILERISKGRRPLFKALCDLVEDHSEEI